MHLFSKIIHCLLRPYWRLTRGLTLGAQAIVIDEKSRILLIRHGYRPGWHFPGGGVEWNEPIGTAMERELFEETGVEITGKAKLHGVFCNFEKFPGDHIALYIVEHWKQDKIPEPNAEIKEIGFFYRDALPEQTVKAVRNRLAEIFDNVTISNKWQ